MTDAPLSPDTARPGPATAPAGSKHSGRILRFLLAGVANTAFGYALYALLVVIGLHPQVALALQFAIGVVWNHTLHGRFVFGTKGYGRFPHYVAAYVAVYLFNAALLYLLIGTGIGPYLAQGLALAPTVVLSYLLVSLALNVPLRAKGGTV
ncbi:GtrA family protein [Aliiroseovarius sp. CAU 1755]